MSRNSCTSCFPAGSCSDGSFVAILAQVRHDVFSRRAMDLVVAGTSCRGKILEFHDDPQHLAIAVC